MVGQALTLLFFPSALVLGRDIDYSVGIDIKCHLDLGDSPRCRGNSHLDNENSDN